MIAQALAAIRCAWRGMHQPLRHPLGGFRCTDCGFGGVDLQEFGYDHGYVQPRASWDVPSVSEPRFYRGKRA